MTDTHTHIDDPKLSALLPDILRNISEGKPEFIINNASDRKSTESSFSLARQYPGIYAALGCHPHTATQYDDEFAARISQLAAFPEVVAVGEIGLDYYYDFTERAVQKKVFALQLELAAKLGLPVCLHVRDAYEDACSILKEHAGTFPGGVMHCYSGSAEMAVKFCELGLYFGFGGPVTYKNAAKDKVIARLPKERILTETDCPYLTPAKKRGEVNRPEYVSYVTETIAAFWGESVSETEKIVRENALRLFPKIKYKTDMC